MTKLVVSDYSQTIKRLNRIDFQQLLSQYEVIQLLRTAYSQKDINTDLSAHKHSFYELHYVYQGTCGFHLENGEKFVVSKNDYIVIPPMCNHQLAEMSEDSIQFIIGFNIIPDHISQIVCDLKVMPATDVAQEILEILLNQNYPPASYASAISLYLVQALTLELLYYYDQSFLKSISPSNPEKMPYITMAKRYIADNIENIISPEDVAKYCSISQRHLNRIMMNEMSISINTFIKQMKTERIKDLLKSTQYPLKKIADMIGMSNEYSLIRYFKRETQMTPNEYRISLQKSNQYPSR